MESFRRVGGREEGEGYWGVELVSLVPRRLLLKSGRGEGLEAVSDYVGLGVTLRSAITLGTIRQVWAKQFMDKWGG